MEQIISQEDNQIQQLFNQSNQDQQQYKQDNSNNINNDQVQEYAYTYYKVDDNQNDDIDRNSTIINIINHLSQEEQNQQISSSPSTHIATQQDDNSQRLHKHKQQYQLQLLHQARHVGNVDDKHQNNILLDDEDGSSGMVIKLNDQAFQQRRPNEQLNTFVKNSNNNNHSEIYSELKLAEENLQFQKQVHHQHTNSRLSAFSYNDSRSSSTLLLTNLTSSIIKPMPYHPQYMTCPHCFHSGMTLVKRENGRHAYSTAGFCCLVGCWAGCSCVPLCSDRFKEYKHYCRECNQVVTKFPPF